jgi:hypothetical protein
MEIKWMLTHEDAHPKPDFTAFDRGKVIGRVCQIEDGPVRGLWLWTMTAAQPVSPSDQLTCGRAAEGGKAGRCLIEVYQVLLAHPHIRLTSSDEVGLRQKDEQNLRAVLDSGQCHDIAMDTAARACCRQPA